MFPAAETSGKIVDTDEDAFTQPSSLRELLTHREDVIYAPRQSQTATFNMRTWALSSRVVKTATTDVTNNATGGGAQSSVSPSKAPVAKKRTKTKQQQWLVDDGGAVEVDKPFFDYTFEHSSILEHRVDCPMRPTDAFGMASIQARKPGTDLNNQDASWLEEQAEARAEESMKTAPLSIRTARGDEAQSTTMPSGETPMKTGSLSTLVQGTGPVLDASWRHPLKGDYSPLPPAFGTALQQNLSSAASRLRRHREKLQFEQDQQQLALMGYEYPGVSRYSHHQSVSRPDSPLTAIKPLRSPLLTAAATDFLVAASGPNSQPPSALGSRPPSQMSAGKQPFPLPEFYRMSSPDPQARKSPCHESECAQEVRATVNGGARLCGGLSTATSTDAAACISTFSSRTQRVLQVKGGSRLRRYYGEQMHLMRRMDRSSAPSAPLHNAMMEDPSMQAHLSSGLQHASLHQRRATKPGSLEAMSSVGGALLMSGSFEESSPPLPIAVGGGHPHIGQPTYGVVTHAGGHCGGPPDYDWRCYQSTTKFLRPDVQRSALVSPCDTKVPLHHPVYYSELYDEQKILLEQRDLHNAAYEETKALYRNQGEYIKVAMDGMSRGEFQRTFPVESSALKDIPELELSRMRLQRDSVPVLHVVHDNSTTVGS